MAGLRPRTGRDSVLDAHGLTVLAAPTAVAAAWATFIVETSADTRIWVPELVLAEATTGGASDANVNRFVKTLDDPHRPERRWLSHELADLRRAAALRHGAMLFGRARISAIDAIVVAMSERLSLRRGATILTSDRGDLQALVAATARPNIAVVSVDRS